MKPEGKRGELLLRIAHVIAPKAWGTFDQSAARSPADWDALVAGFGLQASLTVAERVLQVLAIPEAAVTERTPEESEAWWAAQHKETAARVAFMEAEAAKGVVFLTPEQAKAYWAMRAFDLDGATTPEQAKAHAELRRKYAYSTTMPADWYVQHYEPLEPVDLDDPRQCPPDSVRWMEGRDMWTATGRLRFRRGWFGRAVLQREEEGFDGGAHMIRRWADAKIEYAHGRSFAGKARNTLGFTEAWYRPPQPPNQGSGGKPPAAPPDRHGIMPKGL